MATIVIAVIIVTGCIACMYLLGTLVRAFALMISAICAAIAAFGYFELLANMLIKKDSMTQSAQMLCFVLLFVVVLAIMQVLAFFLTRKSVDFGTWPERLGRVIFSLIAGLIIAGFVTTALAMGPFSKNLPYQRLDTTLNTKNPNKTLLNLDGLITKTFGIISEGSFSGKKSFTALHPDFLNQLFINKDIPAVSPVAVSQAVKVPPKAGIWPASKNLKDLKQKPVLPQSGYNLSVVRIGFNKSALRDTSMFVLAQLSLICKPKELTANPLKGTAQIAYPIGYLRTPKILERKNLTDQIEIKSEDFTGSVKWIDFVFQVPNGTVPVMARFKQNNLAILSPPVTAENAPQPKYFIPMSKCTAVGPAKIKPIENAKIHGLELAADAETLSGLIALAEDQETFQNAQTPNSIAPAQFQDGMITHAQVELITKKPTRKQIKEVVDAVQWRKRKNKPRKTKKGFTTILKVTQGYQIVSLKCNNPKTSDRIKGSDLPVLMDLNGAIHHPAGVVISAEQDGKFIYEIDYCTQISENDTGCLNLAQDGSVASPFPNTIWITEKTQNIYQFYVLYLLKIETTPIIIAVKPADSEDAALFEEHEGFIIK